MRSLIAAVLTATLAGVAPASIINGSFENGTFTGAPFDTLLPGNPNITGWTIGGNSVDWIGSGWQPSHGNRSIDLNGAGIGILSQTFTTVAGQTYQVTFDLAGNPEGLPTTKTLDVQATGNAAQSYSFDTTGWNVFNMGWSGRTYAFTATGSSTTLTFTSTTTNGGFDFYGPALDNVVVQANTVPEPISLVVFGGLVVGGVVVARRRMTAKG